MLKIIARWIIPGLIVILGGTSLAVMATAATISSDLGARSTRALTASGTKWAEISFDARDATLFGTVADPVQVEAARQLIAELHGVRSVLTQVDIAPLARPYPFTASIDNGVIGLSGGVPNAATRQQLLAGVAAKDLGLELRSGQPDRLAWRAGVDFAVAQLDFLDQGDFTLSDLSLSVRGRAKSEQAHGQILQALRDNVPPGIDLGTVAIAAPLVSPYQWSAQSDGLKISISGFVPDQALADQLRAADVAGLPIATALSLASGEPPAFAKTARLLLTSLGQLEHGSATIIDDYSTLSGAPPNQLVAQAIFDDVTPTGTIVVLEPPKIANYRFAATLAANAALVFDGFVPDEAMRERLGKLTKANVAALVLGRGAPARFQSAVDFGLDALGKMSSGQFEIQNNNVTIAGVARSVTDYEALLGMAATGAPQGLVLSKAAFVPPAAENYGWRADKDAQGLITLSGYVPDSKARAELAEAAANVSKDISVYASGEPPRFTASAAIGLSMLQNLASGSLAYDGSNWALAGQAATEADLAEVQAAFATEGLAKADWLLAVTGPQPEISPYVWSASKDDGGNIAFSGNLPNAGLQRYLVVHVGGKAVDNTNIGAGAPTGFAGTVTAGVDALLSLDSGTLEFDGARWALKGSAPSSVRDSVLENLADQVEIADWAVSITVVEPVVVAVVPYVWTAVRSADGGTILSGEVPTDSLRRFAAVRAGKVTSDTTNLRPNAPVGFTEDLLAGLDALNMLDAGTVGFDGTNWSISGELATEATPELVTAALDAATTPTAAWALQLTVKPLAPVVPEPVVAIVPVATAEPAPPVEPSDDPNYHFAASRDASGVVTMTGQVPADATRRYFAVIAQGSSDKLEIAPNAPAGFIAAATEGLRSLGQLSEGQLAFAAGKWSLVGKVADVAQRDVVSAAIAALPDAAIWTVTLSAPPLIDACRAKIAGFIQNNTILFQSGAAVISAASEPALDELGQDLAICPDTVVQIEGHTDADGDEDVNLGLSVARAEAVVEALIARNVEPTRLYAVGYGESQPIASNETSAGKRQNRRIVVTILDEHY